MGLPQGRPGKLPAPPYLTAGKSDTQVRRPQAGLAASGPVSSQPPLPPGSPHPQSSCQACPDSTRAGGTEVTLGKVSPCRQVLCQRPHEHRGAAPLRPSHAGPPHTPSRVCSLHERSPQTQCVCIPSDVCTRMHTSSGERTWHSGRAALPQQRTGCKAAPMHTGCSVPPFLPPLPLPQADFLTPGPVPKPSLIKKDSFPQRKFKRPRG